MYATRSYSLCDNRLSVGLSGIAAIATKTYGTGCGIVYRNASGRSEQAIQFTDFLDKAWMQNGPMEDARAVLASLDWPNDGTKTAVLLAAGVIQSLQENLQDGRKILDSLPAASAFAQEQIKRMARERDGMLVGGGLWLINLIRPLVYFADETRNSSARVLADAAVKPLQAIAENAGARFHEVYERVRAAAPNQFYSLHQIGLKNSHIPMHDDHVDIIRFGLEMKSGQICDLCEKEITLPIEIGQAVIRQTTAIVQAFCNVRCAEP